MLELRLPEKAGDQQYYLDILKRSRRWLVRTLERSPLPARERAAAGDTLAALGDPRFRADRWYLPDEPLLGFVPIPAGPFLMGSGKTNDRQADDNERPQHELTLPGYYLARYPVTVAQFRAFVQDQRPASARPRQFARSR